MLGYSDKPIAVLMTSHNRREKTVACLRQLFAQSGAPAFDVYLVDDGSTDGTGEAIRSEFPVVRLITGDGSLFWAGGMRRAWDEAMRNPYSAYVWLNDDVELDRDALSRLWAAHTSGTGQAILGCAMRGSKEGSASYSGSIQEGSHPFRFRRVEPDCARELEVDVLNGNLVLVPCIVTQKIGGFAKYLVHHGGDYEYCRRASRHGFRSRLLPGTFGVCASNPPGQRKRGLAGLRKAASPKHLPIRMGVPLYRESGGPFWWVWLASYYAKAFVKGF